jgi:tetratricopeptide (TPR) repeat protein
LARKRLTSSFGRSYYKSGRYAEAIATFEEVLASCSKDDSHRCHALLWLGFSLAGNRIYSRARDCFEEVLASSLASENEKASARKGLAGLPTD